MSDEILIDWTVEGVRQRFEIQREIFRLGVKKLHCQIVILDGRRS